MPPNTNLIPSKYQEELRTSPDLNTLTMTRHLQGVLTSTGVITYRKEEEKKGELRDYCR
jgi:hypothetical protein